MVGLSTTDTASVPRFGQLGSFCTIGIGLEWWNDGIVEYWGIPASAATCVFGAENPDRHVPRAN